MGSRRPVKKKNKGKLPIFCGNGEPVVPIYDEELSNKPPSYFFPLRLDNSLDLPIYFLLYVVPGDIGTLL